MGEVVDSAPTSNNEKDTRISAADFLALTEVPKLDGNNPVTFLIYRRKMYDLLKMLRLWRFISPGLPLFPTEQEKVGDDDCRTVLRYCAEGGLYMDTEHCETAKEAWSIIVETCTPKGWGALANTFRKFDTIKASNYENVREYGYQFRLICDELALYPGSIRMDENWFIYKYLAGLPEEARSFKVRWNAENEPFNEDGTKPKLSKVIQDYQTHCTKMLSHGRIS